ncbi:MAG: ATP-binding protein [Thermodesulfovibrionales bacterium]|nr:ATP-binding protein [Thermodesulfovibrionales bacterium]
MESSKHSIVNRIFWHCLLILGVGWLLFGFSLIYIHYKETEENEHTRILSVSMVIAESLSAPVYFGEEERAQMILTYFDKIPEIASAHITRNNEKFVTFDKGIILKKEKVIKIPILFHGNEEGVLIVHYSTQRMKDIFESHTISLLVIGLVFFIFSYFFLSGSIKVMMQPLNSLSHLMKEVTEKKDYNVRADVKSDDEIGELANCFNLMIQMIQKRDKTITEYNINLERIVQDRTQQLIKATEAAESANRAKSQFLANISHEIRTPLNSIVGISEIAMNTTQNDRALKEYMQMIQDSANTLLLLLNDMLDLSKIESGRLELYPTVFNIVKHIDEIVNMFKMQAMNKGLNLYTIIDDNVPTTIKGDSLRLKQVLMNLLSNAIKFTDTGSVELKVSKEDFKDTSDDRVTLHFTVKDTGIGIEADKIDSVFDIFTQEAPSISRRYGGTGLGLSISKRLVEMMGGRIWVISKKGQGSEFHFTADFDVVKEVHEDKTTSVSQFTMPQKKLKILVVEDNQINQIVTSLLISHRGHDVQVVSSAKEAINVLREGIFDVVLMDVQMPDIDGIEATRMIRSDKSLPNPNIPIIAYTAHAMQEDKKRCLDAGMDGYLTKPLNMNDFILCVEAVCG